MILNDGRWLMNFNGIDYVMPDHAKRVDYDHHTGELLVNLVKYNLDQLEVYKPKIPMQFVNPEPIGKIIDPDMMPNFIEPPVLTDVGSDTNIPIAGMFYQMPDPSKPKLITCPECKGEGTTVGFNLRETCRTCDGKKEVPEGTDIK